MSNKEFQVRNGLIVNNTVLVANVITGNVGIGTNTAAYQLDVTGAANISQPTLLVAGQNVLASIASVGVNANNWSNVYANTVGVNANTYASSVGVNANTYASSVGVNANNWSNTYANTVGVNANTYASSVGVNANNWSNTYANTVGVNANNWSNVYANTVGVNANTYASTKLANTSGVVFNGSLTFTSGTTFLPQVIAWNQTADTNGPYFILQKSRAVSGATANTGIGDYIGTLLYRGYDTTGTVQNSSQIYAKATATGAGSVDSSLSLQSAGSTGFINFVTSSGEVMRANGTNIGIGNTAPTFPLVVSATVGEVRVQGTSFSKFSMRNSSGGTDAKAWQWVNDTGSNSLYLGVLNDAEAAQNVAMYFYRNAAISNTVSIPTANVGIGTSSPGYKMTVAGTSGSAVVNLLETGVRSWGIRAGGAVTSTFDIADYTAGASRLVIDAAGNVVIGSAIAYTDKVTIRRSSGQSSYSELALNDGGQSMWFNSNTAPGSWNGMVQAGDHAMIFTNGVAGTGALAIAPWASLTGGIRITSTGNVGISNTSANYPLTVSGQGYFQVTGSTYSSSGTHLTLENPNTSAGQTVQGFTFGGVAKASIRADYTGNLILNANSSYYMFGIDLPAGGTTAYFQQGGTTFMSVTGNAVSHPGNVSIGSNTTLYSNGSIVFAQPNPTLYSSSYMVFPGGIYVSAGACYVQGPLQARTSLSNDTGTYLTIAGGSAGTTYFSGAGGVGVGTTAPIAPLSVLANSAANIALIGVMIDTTASQNNTVQNNIRNSNTGQGASSDFIATTDDGSDTANYIDLGINNSLYNQSTWTINGARDGYLYTSDGGLAIGTANTTTYKPLIFFAGGTLASNEAMRITASAGGANVGIGRTNPGYKLDVVGTVNASAVLVNGAAIGGGGSTVGNETASASTFYPVFTTTTSGTMSVANVNTTSLTFVPSTGTLGAKVFNSLSDISLKTDIERFDGEILLNKIDPKSFNWKDTGTKSYGVIAQELEKVLPELVDTAENGLKSVSYIPMIAMLIDVVKKQQQRIEEIEKKLGV